MYSEEFEPFFPDVSCFCDHCTLPSFAWVYCSSLKSKYLLHIATALPFCIAVFIFQLLLGWSTDGWQHVLSWDPRASMSVWSQSAAFNQKQMHYFQMFFTLGCWVHMAVTVEDLFFCVCVCLRDLLIFSAWVNKSIKWQITLIRCSLLQLHLIWSIKQVDSVVRWSRLLFPDLTEPEWFE